MFHKQSLHVEDSVCSLQQTRQYSVIITHTTGQILDYIFSPLRYQCLNYIHSSEKSCLEQKNAWSRFALILFKLHKFIRENH